MDKIYIYVCVYLWNTNRRIYLVCLFNSIKKMNLKKTKVIKKSDWKIMLIWSANSWEDNLYWHPNKKKIMLNSIAALMFVPTKAGSCLLVDAANSLDVTLWRTPYLRGWALPLQSVFIVTCQAIRWLAKLFVRFILYCRY